MKIFVCVKQVPDTETKIKLKADASGIDTAGIKWVMNPYDEFAVEEAIKVRDGGKATGVTVVSVGPKARTVETLRTALAMGADDAIVIDAGDDIDSTVTAKALAAAIKAEGEFGAIFTGKLAIDDNLASVSQMVAEFLAIPHATVISKLEVGDQLTAEREVEGGTKEVLQLSKPALIAANKGLNMPRYPSLPGIMKAKKKPIKELTLESLGVSASDARTKHLNYQLPAEKPAVKMIEGDAAAQAKTLATLLRQEAKVL
ncbi:MAG: electron transfer flavoprotein subunit beta/FixA family protein [Bdellovibrionales bacterium]|jgi:electron transfer flavoprotein beta subunit|nr:electron transfer flavoprotein subunit beta/FixA family protein [Bdellovibrionales bacterium]